jgi:hypothetical protein
MSLLLLYYILNICVIINFSNFYKLKFFSLLYMNAIFIFLIICNCIITESIYWKNSVLRNVGGFIIEIYVILVFKLFIIKDISYKGLAITSLL